MTRSRSTLVEGGRLHGIGGLCALALAMGLCLLLPEAHSAPPVPLKGKLIKRGGDGFDGPTPTPPARVRRVPLGVEASAIARWDVVPYQTITSRFPVGVMAFHVNGILRVDMSLNGGPWVKIPKPTLNPFTNVVEYWAIIDPARLADGPIEIRAIAYPKAGVPRVLNSMYLNCNAGGSHASLQRFVSTGGDDDSGDGSETLPFRTILRAARSIQDEQGSDADAGVINLLAGDYPLGLDAFWLETATRDQWLTVRPAPGVSREQARLTEPGAGDGLKTKLVHLQNLTIAPSSGGMTALVSNDPLEDALWLDNCVLVGAGRTVEGQWHGGWTEVYATDCTVRSSRDGIQSAALQRNVLVQDIGSDAFSNTLAVVNCMAEGIDHRGTDLHPDVYQFYGADENVILYNLTATSNIYGQGLFAGADIGLKDIAFVNCRIDNSAAQLIGKVFQFGGPTDHLYVLNCAFVGPATWRTDTGFEAVDIVLENTTFTPLGPPDPVVLPGVTYRNPRPRR